jgi:hypothetical protein
MTKTFEEMLEYGTVVGVFPTETVYVIWNGSVTYNAFIRLSGGDRWMNFDCFTNYSAKTYAAAEQAALDWYNYKTKGE